MRKDRIKDVWKCFSFGLVIVVLVIAYWYMMEDMMAGAAISPKTQQPRQPAVDCSDPFVTAQPFTDQVPSVDNERELLVAYIQKINYKAYPKQAELIADAIFAAAEKFVIPYEYLVAMAQIESSFRTDAVSSADCIGLMQVNPKVWIKDSTNTQSLVSKGIVTTVQELYQPTKNIEAGAYILGGYITDGLEAGKADPVKYGVIRYCGRGADRHYIKFRDASGEFALFKLSSSLEASL